MSVHVGVLALLFWGWSALRGGGGRDASWVSIAAWGAALLAVPQVVVAGAGGRVSSLTEVLVFGLTPVVVVFSVAQGEVGFGLRESPLRTLGPALAGLGGLALLVPFAWPVGRIGMAWLFALVASAGLAAVAAVRVHGLLREVGVLRGAAVVCGAAAAMAGGFAWLGWSGLGDWNSGMVVTEAIRCLLIDGPVLLLTMWLLREMSAVRFSTRYLLVPLVTIVEGFLLVRPQWGWTMGAGLLLLGGGCAGLLMADSEE